MSKMLNIALVDVDGPLHMPTYCMDWSTLSEEECSNILHAMNFHHPTEEEAYNAINTLLAYLYYENKAGTFVDVSVMNNQKPKNTKYFWEGHVLDGNGETNFRKCLNVIITIQ